MTFTVIRCSPGSFRVKRWQALTASASARCPAKASADWHSPLKSSGPERKCIREPETDQAA